MKKSRIAFIIIGIVILAVAGVVIYVLTNLNVIVETAIERYGSQAAGTRVRVSSVDIRLSSAQATINGLTVANPQGFTSPHVFKLGNISTRIDIKSVRKMPIVIDDIRISGPEVFYEMNKSGTSNIDVLKKNLPEGAAKKEPGEKKAKGKETRLHIRKLVFENGKVDVRIASRGDRQMTVNLPRIELADIGKNGGATPAQVAQIVVKALAEETAKAVAKSQGERYLRKGAEGLLKRYLK
jgi:uncharacterized protein involved in outer membrane biogenesis